jgi:hypothetical protein
MCLKDETIWTTGDDKIDLLIKLKDEQEKLDKKIKLLKEEIEGNPLFTPKFLQDYYTICGDEVYDARYTEDKEKIVKKRVAMDDVFRTPEAALLRIRWLKIHRRIKELAGGYRFNPDKEVYIIYYDRKTDRVSYLSCHDKGYGWAVYFKNTTDVLNAILKIGQDDLKFYCTYGS